MRSRSPAAGIAAFSAVALSAFAWFSSDAYSLNGTSPKGEARELHRVHLEIAHQSLENYARFSDAIVVAKVTSWSESYRDDRMAETVYGIEVQDRLKGEIPDQSQIHVAGAEYGPRIVRVVGAPRFEIGEQVLLFLCRDAATNEFGILGLGGGTYRIHEDGADLQVTGMHSALRSLSSFKSEIRGLIEKN